MNRLGIIGLGRLASSFVNYYHHKADFWATSRNKEKINLQLREKAELFNFKLDGHMNHLPIKDTSDLIFTVPPSKIDDYAELCKMFFAAALKENPSLRIIFISSTSVYGNRPAKIDEDSKVRPKSANAKKLVEVENFLLDYNSWILRCGGLIGENRHPVYYLGKKKSISKPYAAVNLVHEHDVCRFIKRLIEDDKGFGIYNLVTPEHPERKEYYNDVNNRLGLNPLKFDESDLRKGKIVNPKKALEANFSFEYTSPFEMPLVRK